MKLSKPKRFLASTLHEMKAYKKSFSSFYQTKSDQKSMVIYIRIDITPKTIFYKTLPQSPP